MADPTDLGDLPQATVVPRKRFRISGVWIIPIVAAVVAGWIAFKRIRSEGPIITIVFNAAEGIEAGKTVVKYKDVKIGQVTVMQLTEDYRKVKVTARIARSAAGLMVEDAKFWIVQPRITPSGISGLSALLSGNYIGFQAGKSNKSERWFIGLDTAPVIADLPGRQLVLKAEELGSLGIGAPIYYRRLPVGQVATYGLAPDGKAVEIMIFINAPYDKYVTSGTRFWNASGLDVSVGVNGVDLRTESLAALIAGGVAFDTPPFIRESEPVPDNTVFTLYSDRGIAMKASDPSAKQYRLYFSESVVGLAVGAPVTFLGLPAGEVTSVDLSLEPATAKVRPRVVVTFNPERLIAPSGKQRHALLRRLVEERGLRGQLRTANLLTGKLYVEFSYFPHAPKATIDWSQAVPELPVVSSGLADVEAKLTSIFDKLDKLPLESIGNDLDQTLKETRKLVSEMLVPQLAQELHDALQELARAARSVRVLTDYLERHPESLIRGKRDTSEAK